MTTLVPRATGCGTRPAGRAQRPAPGRAAAVAPTAPGPTARTHVVRPGEAPAAPAREVRS
ncbi:hypothetical protein Q5762_20075 [Streptomyces sp. P9(2023)]|uniref:hypothetical protein n=1 Tax=Streptomyces sp. P9(2023) TaxID=3064394 RepID=UPI0028F400F7|nr:hypothetical protein [Streptomyces sp. P9(2023)]MDT9690599.1 hypothetical protein [Streptomyces sp. P9(2023)]